MMMQQFGWLTGCHSLPKSCENNSKQREPKSWPNVFVLAGRKAEKARTPLVFFNFFITSHRFSILTSSPWPSTAASTAAVRDERGGKVVVKCRKKLVMMRDSEEGAAPQPLPQLVRVGSFFQHGTKKPCSLLLKIGSHAPSSLFDVYRMNKQGVGD
jgi:hypothetical protein